jgi:hypothetical protein
LAGGRIIRVIPKVEEDRVRKCISSGKLGVVGGASVCHGFCGCFGKEGPKGLWFVTAYKKAAVELLAELCRLLVIRAKSKDPMDDTTDKTIQNT